MQCINKLYLYLYWGQFGLINDLGSSPQPEGDVRGLWWASQELDDVSIIWKHQLFIVIYVLEHINNNYHVQVFLFLFVYFFHIDLKKYISNIQQYYPISCFFYKNYFPGSDTCRTQVGDMDPWPVTWPNLSDLVGWFSANGTSLNPNLAASRLREILP